MCRISHPTDNRRVLISKYAAGGRGRLLCEQAGIRRLTMDAAAQPAEIAGYVAFCGRSQLRESHAGRSEAATRWVDIIATLHTGVVG
jgi:hypothetical protein